MKTWIRRSLLGLATLALLGGGAVLVGEQLALQRSQRHIDVNPQPVALRSDPAPRGFREARDLKPDADREQFLSAVEERQLAAVARRELPHSELGG